tara:strand:- start:150 stop:749 length:600 start_codon:yes stop_codon:yes gene_type:complete
MSKKVWKIGSCFSGIDGIAIGIERAFASRGLKTKVIWQIEKEEFCHRVLRKRFPGSRIYNDIEGLVLSSMEKPDIICGGFPCTDISIAGKGEGIHGEKSGLFFRMWEVVCYFRPEYVFMENVPAITIRGLREVLGTISQSGYNAEWQMLSAADCGARHRRERWWCVAYPDVAHPNSMLSQGAGKAGDLAKEAQRPYLPW